MAGRCLLIDISPPEPASALDYRLAEAPCSFVLGLPESHAPKTRQCPECLGELFARFRRYSENPVLQSRATAEDPLCHPEPRQHQLRQRPTFLTGLLRQAEAHRRGRGVFCCRLCGLWVGLAWPSTAALPIAQPKLRLRRAFPSCSSGSLDCSGIITLLRDFRTVSPSGGRQGRDGWWTGTARQIQQL